MVLEEIIDLNENLYNIKVNPESFNKFINIFRDKIEENLTSFVAFNYFYHNKMTKDANGLPYVLKDIDFKNKHFIYNGNDEQGRFIYSLKSGYQFKVAVYENQLYFYLVNETEKIHLRFFFKKENDTKQGNYFIDFIDADDFFVLLKETPLKVPVTYLVNENNQLFEENINADFSLTYKKHEDDEDYYPYFDDVKSQDKEIRNVLDLRFCVKEESSLNCVEELHFIDFKLYSFENSLSFIRKYQKYNFLQRSVKLLLWNKCFGFETDLFDFQLNFFNLIKWDQKNTEYNRCIDMLEQDMNLINPFFLDDFIVEMYKINYSI